MHLIKHQATVFGWSILLFEVSCFMEFDTVPRGPLIGLYGEPLILPCTFPVEPLWDLGSILIAYQRGLDVVHSFYYSRDQLDGQDPRYVSRTSLFIQELQRGNASLKLDKLALQDAGVYTCLVRTNSGSQKKNFEVNVAAFYSEPRLQFSMLTDGVNLLLTSDGGYPSPTLQWLMDNSDITNQTETHLRQDARTGLYVVSSWIKLSEVTNLSLTFILHNRPLGQDIRREIQLYSDKNKTQEKQRCHECIILIQAILLLLLLIAAVLLFVFIRKRIRGKQEQSKQNGFSGMEQQPETLIPKSNLV